MSAGPYFRAQYLTNKGNIVKIRVQPETITFTANGVANDEATGELDAGFPSAKVSGGRSSIGINARLVRFKFTDTPPTGYKPDAVLAIPVLTPTAFAAYEPQKTGTYAPAGTPVAIEIIGSTPEKIR